MDDGNYANVCLGPTIDNQIIRSLFTATIASSEQLKMDEDLRKSLENAMHNLPPTQIGKDGRLMEWLKEYREVDPHHRHLSDRWESRWYRCDSGNVNAKPE